MVQPEHKLKHILYPSVNTRNFTCLNIDVTFNLLNLANFRVLFHTHKSTHKSIGMEKIKYGLKILQLTVHNCVFFYRLLKDN